MRFPFSLEKHAVENEYTNRLYKPFHFLLVVLWPVRTQGPRARGSSPMLASHPSGFTCPRSASLQVLPPTPHRRGFPTGSPWRVPVPATRNEERARGNDA